MLNGTNVGTFCAVYSAIGSFPAIQRGELAKIEVLSIVSHMRRARRHMVQSLSQVILGSSH